MYVAYSEDKVYKDVGTKRQLFIDNDVIAVVKNVTRRQHTPAKHPDNPVIKRDKPWEAATYFRTSCFNVIRDPADGLFRCWYEDFYGYFGYQDQGPTLHERNFFAQSEDGLNWEKPALGKQIIDGRDTNAIFPHSEDEMFCTTSVMLDDRDPDPDRRYKMVYFHRLMDPNRPKDNPRRDAGGLCMAFSPNGTDWTPYEGNPISPIWLGDVEILTFDPFEEKYVIYGRYGGHPAMSAHPEFETWFAPIWPGKPEGVWGTRRRIYRIESDDLFHWSDPVLAFDPGDEDNLDDGHYGFVPWCADEMHLGILNVLHQVDNTMDMYLLNSRDGIHWNRMLDHRPLVPRGDAGSYDQFMAETPSQPFMVGDELWIYYGGTSVHHDWWIYGKEQGLDVPEALDPDLAHEGHHLCLATLRLDGYVSLDATVREGWVETKPMFSTASNLYINGKCHPGGYIDVEIMDGWNNVWSGFSRDDCQTFDGDSVHHQVNWSGGGKVDQNPGHIKLRIYLKNAELYGFQFADS